MKNKAIKNYKLREIRKIKIKEMIIKNVPLKTISKKLKMPYSTEAQWVSRFKKTNSLEYKCKSGCPKSLNKEDSKLIIKTVKQKPKQSTNDIKLELLKHNKKLVSNETIRRF